jgi:hypothetical protein
VFRPSGTARSLRLQGDIRRTGQQPGPAYRASATKPEKEALSDKCRGA